MSDNTHIFLLNNLTDILDVQSSQQTVRDLLDHKPATWATTESLIDALIEIREHAVAHHTVRQTELDPTGETTIPDVPAGLRPRWRRALGEDVPADLPNVDDADHFNLPGVAVFTLAEAKALAAVVPVLRPLVDDHPAANVVLFANFAP
jgi:hypothetical protein